MVSSRRLPVAYNTSTFGDGTRDYTALGTWEAETDNDLVTATEGEILDCFDDSAEFADRVDISGATANSSYFRVVRAASGQGHDGTPNNGVRFNYGAANLSTFSVEGFCQLHDLIVTNSQNSASGVSAIGLMADGSAAIGCIVDSPLNTGSGVSNGLSAANGSGLTAYTVNCLIIAAEGRAYLTSGLGTKRFYNCTSINAGSDGFVGAGGPDVCINCLAHGSVGSDFLNIDTISFSASEDATATGTGSRASQTFTFANAGGNDFHLAAGDGGAKDFGADLSADADYAFDDDIDGETRTGTWDIGFDEVAAAAGVTVSAAMNVAAMVMAASASVVRSVTGAVDIPGLVLSANLTGVRTVAGSLTLTSVSLAASVSRAVQVMVDIDTPPLSMTGVASIVRQASGALALAVPVLDADASGEQLTVSATLVVPAAVLDADAMVSRSVSGDITLTAPVLAGDVLAAKSVSGVLILEAPTLAAQLALEHLVSADITLPEAQLSAQAFAGAVQSVVGLKATVTAIRAFKATVH